MEFKNPLKCDFVVENRIVVEIKAVEEFHPLHTSQLLTYMRLLALPKGVLFNFNSYNIIKDGQKTLVNDIFRSLEEE